LDLKNPDGRATLLDLLADADVLIEGFRPGAMERLGLGPDECLRQNAALVYARMSGWGQEGPLARAAGHDLNYIALTGALAQMGRRNEPPAPPLNLIGDFGGGGLILAVGIVAALLEARDSGLGQVVDAAVSDGATLLMTMMYELRGRGQWHEQREANVNDGGSAFYNVYETADGKYVSLAAMEPKFFLQFLEKVKLDVTDLPDQWDATGWETGKAQLRELFLTKSRQEWCDLLEGTDACFAPVLTMTEAISHPHNVERGVFTQVGESIQPSPAPRFSRTPAQVQRPPALPGQHTDEILLGIGLTRERIASLREKGAVA
jgi:alpha-methylacyl-CoA racemase